MINFLPILEPMDSKGWVSGRVLGTSITKAGRSLLTVILGSCYSGRFVHEDAYQDDEYDYYFYKDDDLDSILSEDFMF
ncbi:hypothetical protein [carnivorous sponge associated iridovirus]|jgi:hypothetical protein|nr:hypothetical protein [carnivorous sponge associated iridovirus]